MIIRDRLQGRPGWLFSLVLLSLILDTGGAFGFKYGVAILVLAWWFSQPPQLRSLAAEFKVEAVLFILAPLVLALISVLVWGVAPWTVLRHSLFLATWLLLPLALRLSVDELSSRFVQMICVGAGLVILMLSVQVVLALLDREDLIRQLRTLIAHYRMGRVGPRPVDFLGIGFVPGVYFRWTLLLIPAAVLSLAATRSQRLLLIVTVLMTLSTGVVLFTLGGLTLAGFFSDAETRSRLFLLLIIACLLVALAAAAGYGPIVGWMASKFTIGWQGTAKRVAQVEDISRLMTADPGTFLLGTGIGSTFYSQFLQRRIVGTEVGQANLIRQFGVPYSIAFLTYVVWLTLQLKRRAGRPLLWSCGLLAIFGATATNPFLLSPVFFLVLVVSRAVLSLEDEARLTSS